MWFRSQNPFRTDLWLLQLRQLHQQVVEAESGATWRQIADEERKVISKSWFQKDLGGDGVETSCL